jgi:hypothetical protein
LAVRTPQAVLLRNRISFDILSLRTNNSDLPLKEATGRRSDTEPQRVREDSRLGFARPNFSDDAVGDQV